MLKKINLYQNNIKFLSLQKEQNFITLKTPNQTYQTTKLPPILDNILPEGINREVIEMKYKLSKNNDFGVLSVIDDALGGINTSNIKTTFINPKIEKFNDYEDIQNFEITDKEILSNLKYPTKKIKLNKNKLSGLSGQQPKITAILENNIIRKTEDNEYSNIIIKIENNEYPKINLIENIYLKSAKKCGLNVVDSFVLYDEEKEKSEFLRLPKQHLIIKRFDRDYKNNKTIECYELATIMNKFSKEKYEVSLEEIMEFLSSKIKKTELEKIAKYYYISYIAKNGDAHIKNITFFNIKGQLKVAPFYDIVNTAIYGFDESLGISLYKNREVMKFSENELITLLNNYIQIDFDNIKKIFIKNLSLELDKLLKLDLISKTFKDKLTL